MSAPAFELPGELQAHEPPEARGQRRDGVRLMVAQRRSGRIVHTRFRALPSFLAAGDVLVINTSATLPAALDARRADGGAVRLHLATPARGQDPGRWWVVELRSADGARPRRVVPRGETLTLAGDATMALVAPYASGRRLWLARFDGPGPVLDHLARHGHPIRYGYVQREWPLDDYQTTFARTPGSAEMPSAGRPFTAALISQLVSAGVLIAPITLHTGVSSPERPEAPYAEPYEVPAATAVAVNAVRAAGGRVVAVGTTAVRALETCADGDGVVAPADGWTDLVISPERGLRAVDGLITGWHEPQASHLLLLEAVTGADLLRRCYRAALREAYLWHEFGDSHLILP